MRTHWLLLLGVLLVPGVAAQDDSGGKMVGEPELGFVLLEEVRCPEPRAFLEAAAELGLGQGTYSDSDSEEEGDDIQQYDFPDGTRVFLSLMDMPHPEAADLSHGFLSPEPRQAARAPAHLLVVLQGPVLSPAESDTRLARVIAAALQADDTALAGMLGRGMWMIKREAFVALVAGAKGFPAEVCVDLTQATEGDEGKVSLLTHGLVKYGREEFLVVTTREQGADAIGFLYDLVRWVVADPDEQFPDGDTIGRTEEERFVVQRVPSPTGEGPAVIRLDLTAPAPVPADDPDDEPDADPTPAADVEPVAAGKVFDTYEAVLEFVADMELRGDLVSIRIREVATYKGVRGGRTAHRRLRQAMAARGLEPAGTREGDGYTTHEYRLKR